MQKLKLLLPLALFLGVFFLACQDDDPFQNNPKVDVAFAGRVIDELGEGVEGALVKAGEESTITDKNGVFRLESGRFSPMHALVTVSKAGFFEISRPFIVEDDAMQTVTIQLLSRQFVGSVSAGSGGVIQVSGGPQLSFPANAFTDANGNSFTGQANIYARYLDPSNPAFGLFVPGDMTAEKVSDEEVFVSTFGMIGVEIQSGSGQKLKIAPGKDVEIRMPILAGQVALSPSSVPLWYYDMEEGHWQEDGSADKMGNEYVGKVTHFTFFSCGSPFPLTQVHGKIYLENTNQPLANALIRITLIATGATSFGYTDGNGAFGGCIPKDEALKLEVMLPDVCGGQVYYSDNIGSFPGVSTLPDIIIPASAQLPVLKVDGKLLTCNQQSVTNGYVKVDLDGVKRFVFPNASGQFGYAMARCSGGASTGTVIGYDLTQLLESNPTTFVAPPNTIDLGNITVCASLSEYVQYTIDGQTFTKVDPAGGLDVNVCGIWTNDSLSTNKNLQFNFVNNGQTGTYPINGLSVNNIQLNGQSGNTLTTQVSAFGPLGDLIIGTFTGSFLDVNGANHSLSGSYRVIREW